MPGAVDALSNHPVTEMSAVLRLFAEPLISLLVLAALAALLRRWWPRTALAVAVVAAVLLYALSTPFVGARLLASLEAGLPRAEWPAAAAEGKAPRAIVVLSAGLRHAAPEYAGATVGPLTLERVRYAARLHRQTGLPILVTGGRLSASRTPVALAMREALESEFGVPVRYVESDSRNTFGNARLSREILKREGIGTVYLVSHAWHLRRAREAFEAVGFRVVPAPTAFTNLGRDFNVRDFVPRVRALTESTYAFHEYIGRVWYRLKYY